MPLVFVEGHAKKTARVKAALPDATYATWRGIRGALKRAPSRLRPSPVVPDAMAGYSGTDTDLGGNEVRAFGLDAGLVDYKIAAIDTTWSGLCFARRKSRR